MISVLVCSANEKMLNDFSKNLAESIGCDYELVIFQNPKGEYSIFQAYNYLAKKAKFEIMLFVHEDIVFHSKDWGNIIISQFEEDMELGLLGICGATYRSKYPYPWCLHDYTYCDFIQSSKNTKRHERITLGFDKVNCLKVVAHIDGMFMATRKSLYEKIKYDGSLLGFHAYDLELSLNVIKKGMKVAVSNMIFVEHLSEGSPNKDWLINHIKAHKKHISILPLFVKDETYIKVAENKADFFCYKDVIDKMKAYGFSKNEIERYVWDFDFRPFLVKVICLFRKKLYFIKKRLLQ